MAEAAVVEITETKPSLVKKLMIPLVLAIVSSGATFAGLKFSGLIGKPAAEASADMPGEEGAATSAAGPNVGKPAFFFTLYPDMLVNFTSDGRPAYLKLKIDVMSHDEKVIEAVEEYLAIVRNNLLTAFQQVDFDSSNRQQSIEQMRELALNEIKTVLANYHGNDDVEGVYFTSFVVQ